MEEVAVIIATHSNILKAGFFCRSGKGSHTIWEHPLLPDKIALSGADGDDAKPYQEKKVQEMLILLKEVQK